MLVAVLPPLRCTRRVDAGGCKEDLLLLGVLALPTASTGSRRSIGICRIKHLRDDEWRMVIYYMVSAGTLFQWFSTEDCVMVGIQLKRLESR
jgi:hypothetical protein